MLKIIFFDKERGSRTGYAVLFPPCSGTLLDI